MQIKIKATGELMHVENSSAVEIFKKLGLIEYVAAAPAAPVATRPPCDIVWKTGFSGHSFEHFVRASCPTCGESISVFNPSEKASWGHAGRLEKVPADVLEQYRKRSQKPRPAPRDTSGTVHFL